MSRYEFTIQLEVDDEAFEEADSYWEARTPDEWQPEDLHRAMAEEVAYDGDMIDIVLVQDD